MGIVCLPVVIGLTVWACGKSEVSAPGGTAAGDIRFQRFTAQPDFHHIYIIVVSRIHEVLVAGRNPVKRLQGAREGVS